MKGHMELTTTSREKSHSIYNLPMSFTLNRRQLMVWSDVENDVIYMKSLDGTGLVTQLVTTNIAAVG